ncbi:MAG: HAD-IA family hydrolase [Acutalibacter sp.]|jgi:phosphoglycolate phosphatase
MKRCFLFDLDGTVADNGEGILKSAQYALDFFGIHQEAEEKLRRFVGPPLDQSFRELYGFSQEQAWQAVEKYRERYAVKGVYENKLYPGIRELLEHLAGRGRQCLATSKPEVFARKILEMQDVLPLFDVVVGAQLDGTRTDKAEVIREVLKQLGNPPLEQVVMIGDRKHDILGAKAVGVACIGVEYGFAPPGELASAGADWIVPTVGELDRLCQSLLES